MSHASASRIVEAWGRACPSLRKVALNVFHEYNRTGSAGQWIRGPFKHEDGLLSKGWLLEERNETARSSMPFQRYTTQGPGGQPSGMVIFSPFLAGRESSQ